MHRQEESTESAGGSIITDYKWGTRQLSYMYISSVLGAGILVVPGQVVEYAGSSAILIWVALAVVCAAIASLFASISSAFPEATGITSIIKASFGRRSHSMAQYTLLLVYAIGNPAMGLAAAGYIKRMFAFEIPTAFLSLIVMVIAIMLTILPRNLLTSIQMWSLRIALVGILGALILAIPTFGSSPQESITSITLKDIGSALSVAFYAYLGWENVSLLSENVRNPEKTFPKAIRISVPTVAAIYIIVTLAYTYKNGYVGDLLMVRLVHGLPGWVQMVLLVVSILAILSATSAWVSGGLSLYSEVMSESLKSVCTPRFMLAALYGLVLLCVHVGLLTHVALLSWTSILFLSVYAICGLAMILWSGSLRVDATIVIVASVLTLGIQGTLGAVMATMLTCLLVSRVIVQVRKGKNGHSKTSRTDR